LFLPAEWGEEGVQKRALLSPPQTAAAELIVEKLCRNNAKTESAGHLLPNCQPGRRKHAAALSDFRFQFVQQIYGMPDFRLLPFWFLGNFAFDGQRAGIADFIEFA